MWHKFADHWYILLGIKELIPSSLLYLVNFKIFIMKDFQWYLNGKQTKITEFLDGKNRPQTSDWE